MVSLLRLTAGGERLSTRPVDQVKTSEVCTSSLLATRKTELSNGCILCVDGHCLPI
jgi:hypothetical protein